MVKDKLYTHRKNTDPHRDDKYMLRNEYSQRGFL